MNSLCTSHVSENQDVINSLLQTALDNLVDGLLIITASGQILQSNAMATNVCQILRSSERPVSEGSQVPMALWQLCHPVFENMASGIETHLGLDVDITNADHQSIRVRIQPLNLKMAQDDCLMLILEDRRQAHCRRALADGKRYGLTPREIEVWRLRLQEESYGAIANQLYIAENTVKKHIKSILAKRRMYDSGSHCSILAS